MCRNPARAATALALPFALMLLTAGASPAFAWPFGSGTPSKPDVVKSATAAPSPAKAAPPQRASAEQRAAASRLDLLSRAAFWSHEFETNSADAEAGVNLAAALRGIGRYSEAADVAGRVLVLQPGNKDALLETGRAQIAANRGFYAVEPLRKVAALSPADWRPWSLLGVAYEQAERPDEALAAHTQALKLAPNSPAVLSNMALFRATHGAPTEAEALLRKAVTEPGAGAQERQNLALVLGMEGKMTEAERLIREDLPPEQANANLAYLRSLSGPGASSAGRSWSAVKQSEAKAPS